MDKFYIVFKFFMVCLGVRIFFFELSLEFNKGCVLVLFFRNELVKCLIVCLWMRGIIFFYDF